MCLVTLLLASSSRCLAVQLSPQLAQARAALAQALVDAPPAVGRRELLGGSAAALALARVAAVDASGGATAGGAYLLRAKERYNARVVAGAKDFRALKASVDGGDATAMTDFFAGDSFEDLCAAGFLLSNAFRINSTQNPDKIFQVQKFKAFKKEADTVTAALKKKKIPDATAAYARASAALDDYMNAVGL
ncbi:hypothetical protein CTAYLR_006685 [Chrysophaeum taylorii]|uniref:Uncharacterized protein n=1 Tax=Chrysophaeum taylorii TaxID=2483200 RepID=A0AAD7UFE6_9STRA|nr:hypothetical protein CTAYLR_006685 [Chrysophaeum taylorii]